VSTGKHKTPRFYWSAVDEQLLRQCYATTNTAALARVVGCGPKQVLAKASSMGLHKDRALIAHEARQNMLAPGHGFRLHQFKPGQVPPNKGVKGWLVGGRSVLTQFKRGNKPHTWMPVGSYRINQGGNALERKVNDLPGPNHIRWRPVSRLVWEEANGPVPDGHLVVFKPGRKTLELEHITLDAVECITKAEHARRNSIHNLPPEFAELARLRGQLNRAINRKAKEAEQA